MPRLVQLPRILKSCRWRVPIASLFCIHPLNMVGTYISYIEDFSCDRHVFLQKLKIEYAPPYNTPVETNPGYKKAVDSQAPMFTVPFMVRFYSPHPLVGHLGQGSPPFSSKHSYIVNNPPNFLLRSDPLQASTSLSFYLSPLSTHTFPYCL